MTALPNNWTDETPFTLEEASDVLFRGPLTKASLRAATATQQRAKVGQMTVISISNLEARYG